MPFKILCYTLKVELLLRAMFFKKKKKGCVLFTKAKRNISAGFPGCAQCQEESFGLPVCVCQMSVVFLWVSAIRWCLTKRVWSGVGNVAGGCPYLHSAFIHTTSACIVNVFSRS